MQKRLRVSHVRQYLNCPANYYAENVLGVRPPQHWVPALGTAVHAALEHLSRARAEGQATSKDKLLEWFATAWQWECLGIEDWSYQRGQVIQRPGASVQPMVNRDMNEEEAGRRGEAMLLAMATASRGWVPLSTKHGAAIELTLVENLEAHGFPGWELKGTIDLVLADGSIRDWKTALKPWTDKKLAEQFQPGAYGWLLEQAGYPVTGDFSFVVAHLPEGGQPASVAILPSDSGPAARAEAWERVGDVLTQINAEWFPPSPDGCPFCPWSEIGGCSRVEASRGAF